MFSDIACDGCQVKSLTLETRWFSEPNPYNPAGTLNPAGVETPTKFHLVVRSKSNLVRPLPGGKTSVSTFTDLKRHDLNDGEFDHFANEQVPQGTLVGFADPDDFTVAPQPRPTREFLTRKLWDAGNTDPYGHRGDLTTLTVVIYHHGWDARVQRETYFDLPPDDQDAVIESLVVMR